MLSVSRILFVEEQRTTAVATTRYVPRATNLWPDARIVRIPEPEFDQEASLTHEFPDRLCSSAVTVTIVLLPDGTTAPLTLANPFELIDNATVKIPMCWYNGAIS